ncbi:MAG: hypothetical protein IPO70_15735 [Bacteroidetes bacterium]|nr:hypothetical protein [Bacteroidota bacterium]
MCSLDLQCTMYSEYDDVTITFNNNPTAANAGPIKPDCAGVTSATLAANTLNSRNRSMEHSESSRRSRNYSIKLQLLHWIV